MENLMTKESRNRIILMERMDGLSMTQIAKNHGISKNGVAKICRREIMKFKREVKQQKALKNEILQMRMTMNLLVAPAVEFVDHVDRLIKKTISPTLKICELSLSVRAINTLSNEGFIHLNELKSVDPKRISNIPNLGPTTFKEIQRECQIFGFEMGEDHE